MLLFPMCLLIIFSSSCFASWYLFSDILLSINNITFIAVSNECFLFESKETNEEDFISFGVLQSYSVPP